MFKAVLAVVAFVIVGCGGGSSGGGGGGGGSSGGTSVTGTDMSGTYILDRVACYSSSNGGGIHTTSTFSAGSSGLTINGNSLTRTFNGTSCTLTEQGTVIFDGGTGYTLTNRTYASSSGANCTANYTLTSNAITSKNYSISGYHLTVLPDVSSYANISVTNEVWFRDHNMAVTSNPPGWCYQVYKK